MTSGGCLRHLPGGKATKLAWHQVLQATGCHSPRKASEILIMTHIQYLKSQSWHHYIAFSRKNRENKQLHQDSCATTSLNSVHCRLREGAEENSLISWPRVKGKAVSGKNRLQSLWSSKLYFPQFCNTLSKLRVSSVRCRLREAQEESSLSSWLTCRARMINTTGLQAIKNSPKYHWSLPKYQSVSSGMQAMT